MLASMILACGALQALALTPAHSATKLPDLRKLGVSDGVSFSEAAEFWSRWKLVNVRYRYDNKEQRFVYANPSAWKALESGKTSFPEGAMFAKVAFATEEDPLFPVSAESRS